jgi:hypothetical protein
VVRREPKVHGCYYLSGDIQMGNATVAKSAFVPLPPFAFTQTVFRYLSEWAWRKLVRMQDPPSVGM